MFKRILACTDGSRPGASAVVTAAAIARRCRSEMIVVNVFHDQTPFAPSATQPGVGLAPEPIRDYVRDLELATERMRDQLESQVEEICKSGGVNYRFRRETGHPAERIVNVARDENADLIVIGSRGLSGVKSVLLGSVSDGVLHHAHCPVLIVHDVEQTTFKSVMVCSDGSECAKRAAEVGAEVAMAFDAEVTLVSVFDPIYADPGYLAVWAAPIDQETLDRCSERQYDEVKVNVTPLFASVGSPCLFLPLTGRPVDRIVDAARERNADLIVLGSRGLSTWRSLLLGSVSDGVVHHAHCPTLVVR